MTRTSPSTLEFPLELPDLSARVTIIVPSGPIKMLEYFVFHRWELSVIEIAVCYSCDCALLSLDWRRGVFSMIGLYLSVMKIPPMQRTIPKSLCVLNGSFRIHTLNANVYRLDVELRIVLADTEVQSSDMLNVIWASHHVGAIYKAHQKIEHMPTKIPSKRRGTTDTK